MTNSTSTTIPVHAEEATACPLCVEDFDETDRNFFPCNCGYQVCLWCLHYIKEQLDGKCPACRRVYSEASYQCRPVLEKPRKGKSASGIANKSTSSSSACSSSSVSSSSSSSSSSAPATRITAGPKDPQTSERLEKALNEIHQLPPEKIAALRNIRVIQRDLVYVIGLPPSIAKREILKRLEFFGQYGVILHIVVNRSAHSDRGSSAACTAPSFCAYITYSSEEEATAAIKDVVGCVYESRSLRASFGTTKYCSFFLRGIPCSNADCFYLHELGPEKDSFTKEEMLSAKHQFNDMTCPFEVRGKIKSRFGVGYVPSPKDSADPPPSAALPTPTKVMPTLPGSAPPQVPPSIPSVPPLTPNVRSPSHFLSSQLPPPHGGASAGKTDGVGMPPSHPSGSSCGIGFSWAHIAASGIARPSGAANSSSIGMTASPPPPKQQQSTTCPSKAELRSGAAPLSPGASGTSHQTPPCPSLIQHNESRSTATAIHSPPSGKGTGVMKSCSVVPATRMSWSSWEGSKVRALPKSATNWKRPPADFPISSPDQTALIAQGHQASGASPDDDSILAEPLPPLAYAPVPGRPYRLQSGSYTSAPPAPPPPTATEPSRAIGVLASNDKDESPIYAESQAASPKSRHPSSNGRRGSKTHGQIVLCKGVFVVKSFKEGGCETLLDGVSPAQDADASLNTFYRDADCRILVPPAPHQTPNLPDPRTHPGFSSVRKETKGVVCLPTPPTTDEDLTQNSLGRLRPSIAGAGVSTPTSPKPEERNATPTSDCLMFEKLDPTSTVAGIKTSRRPLLRAAAAAAGVDRIDRLLDNGTWVGDLSDLHPSNTAAHVSVDFFGAASVAASEGHAAAAAGRLLHMTGSSPLQHWPRPLEKGLRHCGHTPASGDSGIAGGRQQALHHVGSRLTVDKAAGGFQEEQVTFECQ